MDTLATPEYIITDGLHNTRLLDADSVEDSFRAHLQLLIPRIFTKSNVSVSVEQAEACDCQLLVSSHGEQTLVQITEHGRELATQGDQDKGPIFLEGQLLTSSGEGSDLREFLSGEYSYQADISREDTSRGVIIKHEKLAALLLIADFINQAVSLCKESNKRKVKIVQNKEFKHHFYTSKVISLPSQIQLIGKRYQSPLFLDALSKYINQRLGQTGQENKDPVIQG